MLTGCDHFAPRLRNARQKISDLPSGADRPPRSGRRPVLGDVPECRPHVVGERAGHTHHALADRVAGHIRGVTGNARHLPPHNQYRARRLHRRRGPYPSIIPIPPISIQPPRRTFLGAVGWVVGLASSPLPIRKLTHLLAPCRRHPGCALRTSKSVDRHCAPGVWLDSEHSRARVLSRPPTQPRAAASTHLCSIPSALAAWCGHPVIRHELVPPVP